MARQKRRMPKKRKQSGTEILQRTWRYVSMGISFLMSLFFILIFISILGLFITPESIETGNVAVIPITGLISGDSAQSFSPTTTSQDIVKLIEKADEDDDIEAILLEINSPGGEPVATDEIAQAIKKTNKTTVAVIREHGTSGAYWVATAADKIYANRMSMTGSIGVRASSLGFSGLISDYNVTYRRLIAGQFKDAGTPWKDMTPEEYALFQNLLDKLHTEFINAVAENRHLPVAKVRELATGFVFLGSEAVELGLVDELGSKQDALDYLEKTLDIEAKPVTYKKTRSLLDKLSLSMSPNFYTIGQGIGSMFTTETDVSFS